MDKEKLSKNDLKMFDDYLLSRSSLYKEIEKLPTRIEIKLENIPNLDKWRNKNR